MAEEVGDRVRPGHGRRHDRRRADGRPALVPLRAARRGRRAHRPRLRRPHRAAAATSCASSTTTARSARRRSSTRSSAPSTAAWSRACSPRSTATTEPEIATVAAPGRRRLRHLVLSDASATPVPPLPRPRLHLAACARRRSTPWSRGWAAARVGDPARIHTEGHDRPGRGRGRRASRSPRCSGARTARSCSPAAPPRPSPPRSGAPAERGRRHMVVAGRRALRGAPGVGARTPTVTVVRLRPPSGASTPTRCSAAVRPDTALVHVQWGNHEVGTLQPVAEVVAACRERRRARPRRRRAGRRSRARSTSTTSAPTCMSRERPQDGRPARRRRAARAARAAAATAARRRRPGAGPAGRASRTCRPSSAGAPRPSASTTSFDERGRDGPAAHRAVLDGACRASTASRSTATAVERLPHIVCLGIDGHRAPGGAARARPGRHRRALGQRLRVARPSSRHRCSRRWASTPTARCGSRSAGRPPTTTSTPCSPPSRRARAAAATRSIFRSIFGSYLQANRPVSRPSSAARGRGRRRCGSRCAPRTRARHRRAARGPAATWPTSRSRGAGRRGARGRRVLPGSGAPSYS